jgi:DNA-binding YbaB/EbfC family protein
MNIQEMMKQAKIMQQRMQEMQAKLGQMEVEGQAGGGMVSVVMTCRGEVRKVTIAPDAINPLEKEVLEDLVMAAVNLARENADNTLAGETRKMMQELGLPADAQLPGM